MGRNIIRVYDALQQEIERVRLVPGLELGENEYPQ